MLLLGSASAWCCAQCSAAREFAHSDKVKAGEPRQLCDCGRSAVDPATGRPVWRWTALSSAPQTFRNRDGGYSTNYDGIQLMSARSWAAGVPLNGGAGCVPVPWSNWRWAHRNRSPAGV